MSSQNEPRIPLPKAWNKHVRSSLLHVISLAQFAAAYIRAWGADSINPRLRQKTELLRLTATVALLREEIRIKDARMARISPHRRPQYQPVERMAILELRAAQGWSSKQTAKIFLLTDATIGSWMKRIDEEGPNALVQLREPVNRFPQFVRYAVQRLKTLCPSMGKVKIAQMLSRAGLHLGVTTVGRILKEPPCPRPKGVVPAKGRAVTAQEPGHLWHIDLTVVPIGAGLWATWLPFALPQPWPFCWWCAVVVDHYSRRIMKIGVFADRPNCRAICSLLRQTVRQAGAAPKYIVCDRDSIFDCDAFRSWVKRKGIQPPRYGAVGKHGNIAVVERLILTMKNECTRKIVVPLRRATFHRELDWFGLWYNQHRPHMTLNGATPDEVYFRLAQHIDNHASNHGKTGHADRLVPSLVRSLPANREIASAWKSTGLVGGICPSSCGSGRRNRLSDLSLRWIGADTLRRCRVKDDFLVATNHDGEHIDFHCLRHTCGAWLAKAGVYPKTIQTIMRHGSITLTMDTYGHMFPGQEAEAIARVGDLLATCEAPAATGTDDAAGVDQRARSSRRSSQDATRCAHDATPCNKADANGGFETPLNGDSKSLRIADLRDAVRNDATPDTSSRGGGRTRTSLSAHGILNPLA